VVVGILRRVDREIQTTQISAQYPDVVQGRDLNVLDLNDVLIDANIDVHIGEGGGDEVTAGTK
jgi:hypothetical protein